MEVDESIASEGVSFKVKEVMNVEWVKNKSNKRKKQKIKEIKKINFQ